MGTRPAARAALRACPVDLSDYYVYLTEDFLIGSVGHPWEESLCLFGQGLLDVVGVQVDEILGVSIALTGKVRRAGGSSGWMSADVRSDRWGCGG
ncbi:DUF2716 domain-containing protein [Streptomyces sp. NBC_00390]|uniref:DUF2716 domain-containing protein n=1 Tax=Streptomyces sp. NBC_00390 TaxID=2975736 RepID=UPI003FCCB690